MQKIGFSCTFIIITLLATLITITGIIASQIRYSKNSRIIEEEKRKSSIHVDEVEQFIPEDQNL